MKPLGASLVAIAALMCLCLSGAAEANGRAGPAPPSPYASYRVAAHHGHGHSKAPVYYAAPDWRHGAPAIAAEAAWGGTSALVGEAERYVGAGKFTGLPGAWCADAVSAWLRATGRPPLANRMAASALSYGVPGSGSPGDLAVFVGRHGYAYHVGIVVASYSGEVEIVSGNWGHRVARAIVSRGALVFRQT
jgi:hypothetical protein